MDVSQIATNTKTLGYLAMVSFVAACILVTGLIIQSQREKPTKIWLRGLIISVVIFILFSILSIYSIISLYSQVAS